MTQVAGKESGSSSKYGGSLGFCISKWKNVREVAIKCLIANLIKILVHKSAIDYVTNSTSNPQETIAKRSNEWHIALTY